MALREGDKHNFQTLLRAAGNRDIILIESRRKSDGRYVALLAATYQEPGPGGQFVIVPLGEMVDGDPYELYEDPMQYERLSPKDWSPRKGKKRAP